MSNGKNKLNEFLNPKSMLTPGICGALVMTITNAVGTSFGVVGVGRTVMSLALSFLIGTLVFAATTKSIGQKLVFYVLNSLIIFSTAAGTNSAGQAAVSASSPAASSTPAIPVHTQVVERVITNIHFVPAVGHVPLLSTNYSTNIISPALGQKARVRPQFFERWH